MHLINREVFITILSHVNTEVFLQAHLILTVTRNTKVTLRMVKKEGKITTDDS